MPRSSGTRRCARNDVTLRRVRHNSSLFLFAVRRNICLPRNFILAENWRRFWRRFPYRKPD